VWFPQVGKLRQLVVSTDDDRGFAPRPNSSIPFDGVFTPLSRSIVWQINSEGLRHDGDIAGAGDRFRVAAYGDSETFGWAVALEETFERQMEAIDPRVEVLNFGVPGYNVTNVRDHLERTVPRFQPDLALYLVNKNDFNEPVNFTPLSYSHVLLHLRFLWHFSIGKQLRLASRDRSERLETFADEVERMTRFLERRDTPFLIGFLKWKNRKSVREYVPSTPDALSGMRTPPASGRFRREFVNVAAVLKGEPKEDTHYIQSAHRKIAVLFCDVITGRSATDRILSEPSGQNCTPMNWRRRGIEAVSLR